MAINKGEVTKTVLCFVFDEENHRLLMIYKKRGQGTGKMNVPGGKIRPGESAEQAAIRETKEETGIEPVNPVEVGKLEFYFPESESWSNSCTVFTAKSFTGSLIPDTEECSAVWIPQNAVPLDKMWDADRFWMPLLMAGKYFHRAYTFDKHDMVLEEQILEHKPRETT